MKTSLLFFFYRHFLTRGVWFFLGIFSLFQREKKWSQFYFDRVNPSFKIKNPKFKTDARPIWIHAASGEIEYARPLLRLLKNQYPQLPILVTCTSRSSHATLDSLPEIDFWGPSPWDSVKSTRQFLDRWQPRILLIARTDLWPELLTQCEERNIPRILFSSTFNFHHGNAVVEKLKLWCLHKLSKIFTVSEQDCANLKIRDLKNAVNGGDTRYDQVFYRLEHPKNLKEELRPLPSDFVFIAGSTWPEDEEHLVSALTDSSIRTVIAPHEVDEKHLKNLESLLQSKNRSSQRYSQAREWKSDSVLILDRVGLLAEIYTWGNVAFVGGSFKKQVHSVMEPLAAGLYTLVGPFHGNNREAIEFQSHIMDQHALVTQVINSTEIQEHLKKIKSTLSPTTKKSIQSDVKKRMGASERLLKYLSSTFDLA